MLIKEFIQQRLTTLLTEAEISQHFTERLNSRVLELEVVNVGYEVGVGRYKVVGTYKIKPETKTKILMAYQKLLETKFGKNKNVAVMVADLYIQPRDVQFSVDPSEAKGQTLVIVDPVSESNGNRVYAIIRHDLVTTLFFAKSYVPITKEKLDVDYILNKF